MQSLIAFLVLGANFKLQIKNDNNFSLIKINIGERSSLFNELFALADNITDFR